MASDGSLPAASTDATPSTDAFAAAMPQWFKDWATEKDIKAADHAERFERAQLAVNDLARRIHVVENAIVRPMTPSWSRRP